jgi:hypothetical protein
MGGQRVRIGTQQLPRGIAVSREYGRNQQRSHDQDKEKAHHSMIAQARPAIVRVLRRRALRF